MLFLKHSQSTCEEILLYHDHEYHHVVHFDRCTCLSTTVIRVRDETYPTQLDWKIRRSSWFLFREALISSPVLAYFDVSAVTTDLYCDASEGSIGAVLQQTDKDGVVPPVGFYSRKLTAAEERYSTYDRELVGLRDSCLHFRYQLLGVPFTVHTDHSSLRWILSQPDLTTIRQS